MLKRAVFFFFVALQETSAILQVGFMTSTYCPTYCPSSHDYVLRLYVTSNYVVSMLMSNLMGRMSPGVPC